MTARNSMIACIATVLALAGCGGKGSTKLSYTTPVAPLGISFSVDKDGSWALAAGIATPVGTFAIEHSFQTRDGFTYIVMRNRRLGTDQVYKITSTGYVEVHAIGEHKLRIQREGSKVIVDTETISGTLDLKVYPSSSAIARIDFGADQPDIVVTTDAMLLLEYPSMWQPTERLPLASIASISYGRQWIFNECWLDIEWKDSIDSPRRTIWISSAVENEANFKTLAESVSKIAPHIQTYQGVYYLWPLAKLFLFIIVGLLILIGWAMSQK